MIPLRLGQSGQPPPAQPRSGQPLRLLCLGAHADDIEIGCTTAEVIAAEGQPSKRESDAVWLYLFPRRCSDFRVHVTVQFAQGRVVKVTRKRKYTGELCEPVE